MGRLVRGWVLALAVVLSSTPPAICAERPTGEVTVAFGALAQSLDPQHASIMPSSSVARHIFDPLVTRAPDGAIKSALAVRWERVDDLTWRFELRRNVKFHNGEPLTAESVRYTFERLMDPKIGAVGKWLFAGWFDKVEVLDTHSFLIRTTRPYRPLLSTLTFWPDILPLAAREIDSFARKPVGTGPFKVAEYRPSERVALEANESYWEGAPAIRHLTFRVIPDAATRLAALEAGEVDLVTNVPPDARERLENNRDLKVLAIPSYRTVWLSFNLAKSKPLQDVRVRHAINHAIDRSSVIRYVLGGNSQEAVAPQSVRIPYAHQKLEPYVYDLDRARKLLTVAGHGDGLSVVLGTPSGRYIKDREVAEAIAGQLRKAKIHATVEPLEWGAYFAEAKKGDESRFDLMLSAWGNIIADPDFGLRGPFYTGGTFNLARYSNPKLDALLDQGSKTFQESEVREIYREAQEIIWKEAPVVFLYYQPEIYGLNRRLRGFTARPDEFVLLRDVAVQRAAKR